MFFVIFPFGVLGQVGYMIVSIPDICFLTFHISYDIGIKGSGEVCLKYFLTAPYSNSSFIFYGFNIKC